MEPQANILFSYFLLCNVALHEFHEGYVFVYDVLPEIAAPLADEADVLEERLQALSEEITVS
jgi:hypothetical protein